MFMYQSNNNRYYYNFLFLLIFLFISLVNQIPDETFLASGDFYQFIDLKLYISKYLSSFTIDELGVPSPLNSWILFFIPYNLLSSLFNFSFSYFPSIYFFIFLSCSYFSFLYSQFILFDLDNSEKNSFNYYINSFLYSLNGFTVFIFWYTWGFSFYLSIYFFIPIIFAVYYKFNLANNFRSSILILFKYSLIFFISNIAFANLGWLVHLFIIFLFLNLYNLFNGYSFIFILKKQIIFFIFFVFILSPSLLSVFNFSFSYLTSESSFSSYINPYQYVKDQVVYFKDLFYLHSHIKYFQINTLFKNLSFLYYPIIILLIFICRKKTNKFFINLMIILLLLSLFLLTKGYFLNSDFINYMFAETFLYGLRSSEKIYYFIPFIIFILISETTRKLKFKLSFLFYLFLFFISLSNIYPLFKGNIYDNFNITSLNSSSNYEIIKPIPKDIKNIANIVNNDPTQFRILFLPYNRDTSEGWSYYKSIGHNGIDPYHSLFKNSVIGSGTIYTNQEQIVNRDWNTSNPKDSWHFNLIRNLGIKYIIFNKSTHDFFVDESKDKIDSYLKLKYMNLVYQSEEFNLYQIKDSLQYGLVYSPDFLYQSDQANKYKDLNFLNSMNIYKKYLYINSNNFNSEIINLLNKYNIELNNNFLNSSIPKISNINKMIINNLNYIKGSFTFDIINNLETGYLSLNFRNSYFWRIKCLDNCSGFESKKLITNNYVNSWSIKANSKFLKISIYNVLNLISIYVWIASIISLIITKLLYIRYNKKKID